MSIIFNDFVKAVTILAFIVTNLDTVLLAIIDTKHPISILEKVTEINDRFQSGEPNNSYFGYSLAFIKENGTSRGPSKTLKGGTLYIGAPLEKRALKNSGVVWKCNFDGDNAKLSCSVLPRISVRNNEDERCLNYDSLDFNETVTDQWIGASLSVSHNNSYLVACAPRWKMNSWMDASKKCTKETALTGECYAYAIPHGNKNKELNPFHPTMNKGKNYAIHDAFWEHNVTYYEIQYTQFGFSSHVTKQGTFLAGAPSTSRGSGMIVHYKNIWKEPEVFGTTKDYISLGYSVTSGRTHGDFTDYIAAGAPRGGNLKGVVHIFDPNSKYTLCGTYEGIHFGSYFGYAVATVDLHGDGNDKLIVGAPTDTSLSNYGSAKEYYYDTGCIYIYDVSMLIPIPMKLCMDSGKVSRGGRFGSAIVNLGDINFDKKEDFAVSAPYDGVGTVFIYYGSDLKGEKPVQLAQVIRGKSMVVPVQYGFGTALLGGKHVDIDGNGTPDLIIGSFHFGHVTVLRTRSVAKATVKVSFHNPNTSNGGSSEILRLPLTLSIFEVRICVELEFSIPLNQTDTSFTIDAWIRYDLDEKENRIGFVDGRDNKIEQIWKLSPFTPTCLNEQLKLIKDISYDNNENPIQFHASVKFNQTKLLDQPMKSADIVLISFSNNVQTTEYQSLYHGFNQYLPAPFFAQSVKGLEINKDNCESDGNPECSPELNLNLEVFYRKTDKEGEHKWTHSTSLIVGQLDSLFLSIIVANTMETAYLPVVRVVFSLSEIYGMDPNSLDFKWQNTPGRKGECKSLVEGHNQKRDLSNIPLKLLCTRPLHHGRDNKYLLEIRNLKYLKLLDQQIDGNLSLKIDAYPNEQNMNESQLLVLPLIGNLAIDVTSSVPSTAQSPIDPKSTNFISLKEFFIVKNSGFSATLPFKVKAEVLIPIYLNLQGSFHTQFIGVAKPSSNEGVRCHAINSTFFKVPNERVGKNSKGESTLASMDQLKPENFSMNFMHTKMPSFINSDNFITMNGCDGKHSSELCQKLECYMDLPSKGSREIHIQMYLIWDATENHLPTTIEIKGIRVETIARVYYFDKKMTEKSGETQREFISTIKIPIWIYGASGLGGAILLLLLVFILFKCGFFRRKKREKLETLKRKTMQTRQTMDPAMLLELMEGIHFNE